MVGSPERMTIDGLRPEIVHDLADRAAHDSLDAEGLFFLDGSLNTAPLDEILRLDDRQHLDQAVRLDRPTRCEPQRHARFGAIVDHDEIGAFGLSFSHLERVLR